MRILYLCNYYHRAMIFRDSMNYLEKRGHEVMAFNSVIKNSSVDEKYLAIMDDKVIHKECFTRFDRYYYFGKQEKILKALLSSIDVDEFDVLHSHTLFNGGWVARRIYKKTGIPYIVSVRNTDMNDYLRIPIFKVIAKIIINDAKHIQFLSEAYREAFIQKCFPNNPEVIYAKSSVITNGLEPFWIEHIVNEPKKMQQNQIHLLCVGKIDKNKNMKGALEAMKILDQRGYQVKTQIVGQVLDSEIASMIQGYENTEVLDYMTKEELIYKYQESDIYVMPSFTESFGRVYAEAMTQGLPIIFTRGQGFDGQFQEGYVGYSVNPTNYSEIADRIEEICNNYTEISSNCLKECHRFDWNQIAISLEDMYQKVVNLGEK